MIKLLNIIVVIGGVLGVLAGLSLIAVYLAGRKNRFNQVNPAQRDLKKGYEKTPFLKSV